MNQGFYEDGSFRFTIPLDFQKGKDGKIWIQGIASTEDPDFFGETVVQNGLDISYFLKKGYFNWNHESGPDSKIGVPTEGRIGKDGFFVKGYLLDTPAAKRVVDLAEGLRKAGSPRRLGFSVEGKIKQRHPEDHATITKSWVKDVALTAEPINQNTYCDIFKSMSLALAGKQTESQFRKSITAQVSLISEMVEGLRKSLEAGYQAPSEDGGSALRQEDLEGAVHTTIESDKKKKKKKRESGGLTKSMAVDFIIRNRGYSPEAARRMVDYLYGSKAQQLLISGR